MNKIKKKDALFLLSKNVNMIVLRGGGFVGGFLSIVFFFQIFFFLFKKKKKSEKKGNKGMRCGPCGKGGGVTPPLICWLRVTSAYFSQTRSKNRS